MTSPHPPPPRPPIALTIAGSDSGGGAGIQADLNVFQRFRVFGTSAITAITAQNTQGVERWTMVDPAMVRAQIRAVATDLRPRAVKSGMLGTSEMVKTVANAIRRYDLHPYVMDPVMISTSGDRLTKADLCEAMRMHLLPVADIVTPNVMEAAALLGEPVQTLADMVYAAKMLVERMGANAVLVTGGHRDEDRQEERQEERQQGKVIDVWYDGDRPRLFEHRRVAIGQTHGTGCTLSAAIAARLALGDPPVTAVRRARAYVRRGLAQALDVGQPGGGRPLNHWV